MGKDRHSKLQSRYQNLEDYHDADRVLDAGIFCLLLTILLPVLWLPTTILGAIAVQKRRTLGGTLLMCLAPFAFGISLALYSYVIFGAVFDSSIADDLK